MPLINHHDTIPYPASNRLTKPPTSGKKPITKTPSKPIIRTLSKPPLSSKKISPLSSKKISPLSSKKSPGLSKKPPLSSKKPPPPSSKKPPPPSSKKSPGLSKKTTHKSKPLEMLVSNSRELITKQARQPASPKKIKPIDIIRASHRSGANTELSKQRNARQRKVREKAYVGLFMKHHGASETYKSIQQGDIDPNELQIKINIPDGSDINRFEIGLHFDHQDDVRTIIITDKEFYDGLFYTEVIKTERYKEAWEIMRHRYLLDSWIDKYIYFLLHAPSILPILMGADTDHSIGHDSK